MKAIRLTGSDGKAASLNPAHMLAWEPALLKLPTGHTHLGCMVALTTGGARPVMEHHAQVDWLFQSAMTSSSKPTPEPPPPEEGSQET